MKEIKLTEGKTALVDDEDYEYLNELVWVAEKIKRGVWQPVILSSQLVMGEFLSKHSSKKILRYADGNYLNCQRKNLISSKNQHLSTALFKSKHKGVYPYINKVKSVNSNGVETTYHQIRFIARIFRNGKVVFKRCFKTEKLAIAAHKAAKKQIR